MPEAEDVILDAAERVTAATRELWRRHRPAPADARGASFEDHRRRISMLLTAALGVDLALGPSDAKRPAGWLARRFGRLPPWRHEPLPLPSSDGARILLPRRLDLAPTPAANADTLRVMALVLAARIARGWLFASPRDPLAGDLFWIGEGALAERRLAEELPGLARPLGAARALALGFRPAAERLSPRERFVEDLVGGILREDGRHGLEGPASPGEVAAWARETAAAALRAAGPYRGVAPVLHWGEPAERAGPRDAPPESNGERGERRAPRSRTLPRRPGVREEEDEDGRPGPFVIPFTEPQQTVEDAAGLRRLPDRGEDVDLEILAEELGEQDEIALVRSDEPVREVLEAEIAGGGSRTTKAPAADPGAVLYPEWDHRTGTYRERHCLLREEVLPPGDPEWAARALEEHRALVETVRRRFEQLRPRRRREARQLDGDELDLDAWVEDYADRRAGRTASDRLYLAERPAGRDVAVALLLDASGSSDSWVVGRRRVLDVEKEAILVLCEALERLRDRYAVCAFSGPGARRVSVGRIKAFGEPYGPEVRSRIGGIGGDAFTRLGAPVRHLSAALAREAARERILLLLSDGKPNDEDEYEGAYGVEDVRQAVAEARAAGIHVFCLAIRRDPGEHLARIFGPSGYACVADVAALPVRLPEVYRLLTMRPR